MSFLTRTTLRAVPKPSAQRFIAVAERRAFHLTGARAALSESDRSKGLLPFATSPPPRVVRGSDAGRSGRLTNRADREDVDKEIDHHKNEQLEKQKEGKGQWKSELASNSESAV